MREKGWAGFSIYIYIVHMICGNIEFLKIGGTGELHRLKFTILTISTSVV